jgi:hypothetical protein
MAEKDGVESDFTSPNPSKYACNRAVGRIKHSPPVFRHSYLKSRIKRRGGKLNLEQLGLFGVFLAGAIPWFEAIAVVPAGILFGLDPVLTVIAAATGNIITIAVFAYGGNSIRNWIIRRRVAKGKDAESPKLIKAQQAFDKYGIYGMAVLGPVLIGTQFAAAASVAAGVKPLKVTVLISTAMVLWAVAIAWIVVALGISVFEGQILSQ